MNNTLGCASTRYAPPKFCTDATDGLEPGVKPEGRSRAERISMYGIWEKNGVGGEIGLIIDPSSRALLQMSQWGHCSATDERKTMHAVWVREKANSTCGQANIYLSRLFLQLPLLENRHLWRAGARRGKNARALQAARDGEHVG